MVCKPHKKGHRGRGAQNDQADIPAAQPAPALSCTARRLRFPEREKNTPPWIKQVKAIGRWPSPKPAAAGI